jgi:hypothetical protein
MLLGAGQFTVSLRALVRGHDAVLPARANEGLDPALYVPYVSIHGEAIGIVTTHEWNII